LDPPKFCCVISNKSAQISQNFRAVTACGQRHHKFELLFPQLFERGAEDYVVRGRRGVAGRARSGVQAPGHSLQPIVSVIPAVNDATLGVTASGSVDPPRETKRASFSKVGLFRSCAPDRPTLEKWRVKAGPTQISKQISRNLGQAKPQQEAATKLNLNVYNAWGDFAGGRPRQQIPGPCRALSCPGFKDGVRGDRA